MTKDTSLQLISATASQMWPIIAVALFLSILGKPTHAADDPSVFCDLAARSAAQESGVPVSVFQAIARTETGHKVVPQGAMEPWPWTVNMEGQSVWFETELQAMAYVFRHFKNGARSFDIGCFQVNYRWHGHAFQSIEDMFDPLSNARHAATIVSHLYAKYGDWTEAVGAYHSRTQKFASRHIRRHATIHDGVPDIAHATQETVSHHSLEAQSSDPTGSLMPLHGSTGAGLFFDIHGG